MMLKQHPSYGRALRIPADLYNTHLDQLLYIHHDNSFGIWNDFYPPFAAAHFRIEALPTTLDEAMKNPDFPMRFALDWSGMTREERKKRAIVCASGSFDELRELVNAIALTELWRHQAIGTGRVLSGRRLLVKWFDANRNVRGAQPNARLRRWHLHLQRVFAPRKDALLAARHLCVERLPIEVVMELKVSPPTRHELLEAALLLRDWARDKIPSDELRLLLPKL